MTCAEGSIMFAEAETAARMRLAESHLAAIAADEIVVDLFCGAGGWTALKTVRVDAAVNHSPLAIAFHRANNDGAEHHEGDAWRTPPRSVTKGRPVGLLLASAACTTHSRARGAAPIAKRVHMLGWCIARWLKDESPRAFLVENVPEWQDWGPAVAKVDEHGAPVLDAQGRVQKTNCARRKGAHFRKWLRYVKRLGYAVEYRVLDAVDYGAASRRKRLFVMGRRDGAPLVWPEVTHGRESVQGGSPSRERSTDRASRGHHGFELRKGCVSAARGWPEGRFGEGQAEADRGVLPEGRGVRLIPHRTAAEVIDWSDLGTSIFSRKRPLKEKTLARIAEGIRRFVLNDTAPFIMRTTQTGGGWHVAGVGDAMRTQTTRQDLAVCTPLIAPQNTGVFGQRPDRPAPTVTTKGHQSLISPVLTRYNGEKPGDPANVHRVDRALLTVPTENRFGLVSPLLATVGYQEREGQAPRCAGVDAPMGTIVGDVKGAVVAPVMAYLNHGGKQTGRVDEPARTVVAGGGHASLVAAFLVQYYSSGFNGTKPNEAMGAVVTKDRHGLVVVQLGGQPYVIVDILFRMLRAHELAAAMGFPPDYVWPKSQRDAVKLIGNAVSPPMGAALIGAMFPRGQKKSKQRAAA